MKRYFLAALLLFGCSLSLPTGALAEEPVRAKLLASHSSISPGSKFQVGVFFEILDGWHIYGKNPGDSGLPTKITISPADVFTVSEPIWPKEERFEQAGDIVTFGYSKPVLIPLELEAPANLEIGKPIQIRASLSWLNCSATLCIPKREKLSLELRVTEQLGPKTNSEFF